MKKLMLGLAITAFAFSAQAQNEGFSKGNIFMTGSLGISSENNKNNDSKSSSFIFSPSVGYFLTDNVAVGVGLGIGSSKSETGSVTTEESSIFNVGGFGRYYFSPKSRFSMFGHLGVNYNTSTEKVADPDLKTTGMDIFAAPGFNYFVSNKLALEVLIGRIGYSSSKNDSPNAKAVTNFDFGINLSSVSFGINYKF